MVEINAIATFGHSTRASQATGGYNSGITIPSTPVDPPVEVKRTGRRRQRTQRERESFHVELVLQVIKQIEQKIKHSKRNTRHIRPIAKKLTVFAGFSYYAKHSIRGGISLKCTRKDVIPGSCTLLVRSARSNTSDPGIRITHARSCTVRGTISRKILIDPADLELVLLT